MKKKSILVFTLFCCMFVSCRHHKGDISIEYSESRNYYSMNAWFGENQTREVEEYLDEKIGRQNNVSFVRTKMDGWIGLDDHTNFFIKKFPGHISIELDKRKNSHDSYRQIKSLCEGMKEVLK